MNLQRTKAEIVRAIRGAVQRPSGRKDTTLAIKRALLKIGKKHGYQVCTGEKELDSKVDLGEWLFDLVWVVWPGRELDTLKGLKLAVESELSRNEDSVLYDFLKLTAVIADLRLGITRYSPTTAGKAKFSKLVNRFKRICPPRREFQYMVIGVPENESDELLTVSWSK